MWNFAVKLIAELVPSRLLKCPVEYGKWVSILSSLSLFSPKHTEAVFTQSLASISWPGPCYMCMLNAVWVRSYIIVTIRGNDCT